MQLEDQTVGRASTPVRSREMRSLGVGDEAPDFTLPGTIDEKVTLSDYIGEKNIVLVFYFLDWTPFGTRVVCGFRDRMEDIRKTDTEVFGLNVDSVFSHKVWAKTLDLNFQLLSDFNRKVSREYGVIHENVLGFQGVSKKSVFIIDKEGIVRYKWISEDPSADPSFEDIIRILRQL
jgi:peroxiredoxin